MVGLLTVTVTLSVQLDMPLDTVTEYVVVCDGLTSIEAVVSPVDHEIYELQCYKLGYFFNFEYQVSHIETSLTPSWSRIST